MSRTEKNKLISVTVVIKRSTSAPFVPTKQMSHEKFSEQFRIDSKQIRKLRQLAEIHRLKVGNINTFAGTVELRGTVECFNQAFQIKLGNVREYKGDLHIPRGLKDTIEEVVGLSNRPINRVRSAHNRKAGHHSGRIPFFTAPQVAKIYRFPP